MKMYDTTNITNATGIFEVVKATNSLVGGVIVSFLVLAFFFIVLISLKKYDFNDAITTACFASFIVSLIFSFIGMLNFIFPLVFLLGTAFGLLWIHLSK